MYRITAIVVGLVALMLITAPAVADNWADCSASGADRVIKGCSAIINAGNENKQLLVIAYVERGSAYLSITDFDRAIADYDKSIGLDPKSAISYFSRGSAYLSMDHLDRAIADYSKAVELKPDFADAFLGLGLVYFIKGDVDRAIHSVERALILNVRFFNVSQSQKSTDDRRRVVENSLRDLRKSVDQIPASDRKAVIKKAFGDFDGQVRPNMRLRTAELAAAEAKKAAKLAAAGAKLKAQSAARMKALLGKRVALVIGNSTYQYVHHLPNPVNDANDIATALEKIGFTVHKETNLDFYGMRKALRDFGDEAAGADVAAIFFAGHGLEMDKQNYLVPVDAQLRTDRDVPLEAIPLDYLLSAVEGAKGLRLVFLDACRNDPFASRMKMTVASRSIGRGLSRVDPPGGILVSFSAKDGTEAQDGDWPQQPLCCGSPCSPAGAWHRDPASVR